MQCHKFRIDADTYTTCVDVVDTYTTHIEVVEP
jgi:hypothetical protein